MAGDSPAGTPKLAAMSFRHLSANSVSDSPSSCGPSEFAHQSANQSSPQSVGRARRLISAGAGRHVIAQHTKASVNVSQAQRAFVTGGSTSASSFVHGAKLSQNMFSMKLEVSVWDEMPCRVVRRGHLGAAEVCERCCREGGSQGAGRRGLSRTRACVQRSAMGSTGAFTGAKPRLNAITPFPFVIPPSGKRCTGTAASSALSPARSSSCLRSLYTCARG